MLLIQQREGLKTMRTEPVIASGNLAFLTTPVLAHSYYKTTPILVCARTGELMNFPWDGGTGLNLVMWSNSCSGCSIDFKGAKQWHNVTVTRCITIFFQLFCKLVFCKITGGARLGRARLMVSRKVLQLHDFFSGKIMIYQHSYMSRDFVYWLTDKCQ